MRIKSGWAGIKVEMLGNTQGPLHYKQRFEGATEESKVLVADEQTVIENIIVSVGGFQYEVEMSLEESIQQIKNAREICTLIREEMNNFADFFPQFINKIEGIATDMNNKTTSAPTEEAPVADEVVTEAAPSFIQTVVAKVLAEMKRDK